MRTQGLIFFLSFTGSLFAGRIDSLSIQHGEYVVLHESGPLSGDGRKIGLVSGCGGDHDCIGHRAVVDLTTMKRTDVEFSEIRSLSFDGAFVGGRAYDGDADIWGPAIWNSGVLQVIHPARNSRSHVSNISTDGRTVSGRVNGNPFVGTRTEIAHPEGAPKMEGEIVAMSNNGRFLSGYTFVDTPHAGESRTIAFRWTTESSYEPIGVPPGEWSTRASAMSQDGRVIAGTSSNQ